MPKIFPIIKKVTGGSGPPPPSDPEKLTISENTIKLNITPAATEPNATPTHADKLDIRPQAESVGGQSHTDKVNIGAADEPNAAQVLTDRLGINAADEPNATPSHADRLGINAADEAVAAKSHADSLRISGNGDSVNAPTHTQSPNIVQAETRGTLSHTDSLALDVRAPDEPLNTPTHADKVGIGMADTKAAHTEGRQHTMRWWCDATSDNDANRTNHTNAQGAPNNNDAIVSTALAVLDTTNPVEFYAIGFGSPPSTPPGTVVEWGFRVFFSINARVTVGDTITLLHDQSDTPTMYTHSGTSAQNFYSQGRYTRVDNQLLGGTPVAWSDFINGSVTCRYLADVVALPETAVRIDAVCIELTTVL